MSVKFIISRGISDIIIPVRSPYLLQLLYFSLCPVGYNFDIILVLFVVYFKHSVDGGNKIIGRFDQLPLDLHILPICKGKPDHLPPLVIINEFLNIILPDKMRAAVRGYIGSYRMFINQGSIIRAVQIKSSF